MICHRVFSPRCVGIDFADAPSMVREEFSHDADINNIVKKFLRTGTLNMPNADRPLVDGFSAIGDFTESASYAFDRRHEEILAHSQQEQQQVRQQQDQQQEQQQVQQQDPQQEIDSGR